MDIMFDDFICDCDETRVVSVVDSPLDVVADRSTYFRKEMVTIRHKVMPVIQDAALGLLMSAKVVDDIVASVGRLLKLGATNREALRLSLISRFSPTHIDKRLCYIIAAYIAGNLDFLRRGAVIRPWTPDTPEWCPVEVIDNARDPDRPNIRHVKIFIAGGPAAGIRLTQSISDKFIRFILSEISYAKFKPAESSEILGIWFLCEIIRRDGRIVLGRFSATSSQKTHNRELYKGRHGACPFKRIVECWQCSKTVTDCWASIKLTKKDTK
jgi:hypothetical protein